MKIAIIGAMDIEIKLFIEKLNLNKKNDIYVGKYLCHDILVIKSGIGKVNSAIKTQSIIDKYKVDLIINSGCAGSLINDIKLLDIVIPNTLTYHDFYPERVMRYSTPDNGDIKVDSKLIEIVENSLKMLKTTNYHIKPIASGDAFITNNQTRDEIYNRTKAIAVDMESTSIAHTCKLNNTPFIIIRTISDFSDGIDDFEETASLKSSEIVLKIIENL